MHESSRPTIASPHGSRVRDCGVVVAAAAAAERTAAVTANKNPGQETEKMSETRAGKIALFHGVS